MPSDFDDRQSPEVQVTWLDSNHFLQKQVIFSAHFSVGRSPDNDFVIANPSVSRRHFEVKWKNGAWWIEDQQSSNGTYVNQN